MFSYNYHELQMFMDESTKAYDDIEKSDKTEHAGGAGKDEQQSY